MTHSKGNFINLIIYCILKVSIIKCILKLKKGNDKEKDMCITQKLWNSNGKGITNDKILNKLIKYIKIIRKWRVILRI